jgi:predicted ATPase
LLSTSDHELKEAEAALQRATEIAAGQGAKLLELRASVGRARLWAERGERQKAFEMLSPIYGWFTQGFDTPDVLRARTLLGELK